MPNICNNTLTFMGKNKDLLKIKNKAEIGNEVFQMDKFVPIPEDVLGYNGSHGKGIRRWVIDHWGSVSPSDSEIAIDIENRTNAINFIKEG